MATIFFLVFLSALVGLVYGLIKPSVFKFLFKKTSRIRIVVFCSVVMFLSLIGVGLFAEPVEQIEKSEAEVVQETQDALDGNQPVDSEKLSLEDGLFLVTYVVDGDTIDVQTSNGVKRIRFIGVDTPETVHPSKPVECFGKEASNFTTGNLQNKNVRLESDSSQGDLDKYDRFLRYVFLEDGTNFNLKLVEEGYAYEYTYSTPYKYQQDFKTAQEEAESAKRGLWADGVCQAVTAPDAPSQSEQSASVGSESEASTPLSEPPLEPPSDPTPTSSSSTPEPSCSCQSNKYNCTDFSNHADAQSVYDCCYAQVGTDVHKLDRDGDGLACETLN